MMKKLWKATRIDEASLNIWYQIWNFAYYYLNIFSGRSVTPASLIKTKLCKHYKANAAVASLEFTGATLMAAP